MLASWLLIETFLADQAEESHGRICMTIVGEALMTRPLPGVVNPAIGIRLFAATTDKSFPVTDRILSPDSGAYEDTRREHDDRRRPRPYDLKQEHQRA